MRTIRVQLGERSYEIRIGRSDAGDEWFALPKTDKALLVTDQTVDGLYGERAERAWRATGADVRRIALPPGEQTKSMSTLERLCECAAEHGMDRAALVVALGGGVVGDLAGFLAAVYMRGIGFWQMPTTLLAMVDSAVGGKTGVNLPQGKNLAGAFHQPSGVTADVATLASLPEREYVSGLAEVAKYGVIRDAELVTALENGAERLAARDPALLEDIVARCCQIKADIVAGDEREAGERAILNFGHTLGHALEKTSGYGRLSHGEAVALGMAYALRLSVAAAGLLPDAAERATALLARLGLPIRPNAKGARDEWTALRAAMGTDKKSRDGHPRFVLAETLGRARPGCETDESVLRRVYEEWIG